MCALLEGERNFQVVGLVANVRQVLIESKRTKPDVILLESTLSGGKADICRTLFTIIPSVRIIMTIWDHGDQDAAFFRAVKAGAQGVLPKSVSRVELIQAIHTVARGASHFGSECRLSQSLNDRTGVRPGLRMLSPQEQRIISLIAEGNTNKEIAGKLTLSEKTVKNYIANMFTKLEIRRRTQAAAFYYMKTYQHLAPVDGRMPA